MIQIISKLKLKIFSGKASSLPPIGPILGQNAINCARFCNDFNAITKNFHSTRKLSVQILLYSNKSYSFRILQPSVSDLIKEYINKEKASINPGREICCVLSCNDIVTIAKKKICDMNIKKLYSAVKIVEGTARSMGIQILKTNS
jgi:large subunit ribosomal protein L11